MKLMIFFLIEKLCIVLSDHIDWFSTRK